MTDRQTERKEEEEKEEKQKEGGRRREGRKEKGKEERDEDHWSMHPIQRTLPQWADKKADPGLDMEVLDRCSILGHQELLCLGSYFLTQVSGQSRHYALNLEHPHPHQPHIVKAQSPESAAMGTGRVYGDVRNGSLVFRRKSLKSRS